MTSFVILVEQDCFASPLLDDVLRFCRAAILAQHQIDHLFFYRQAVLAIAPEPDLPTDEPDLVAPLLAFCQQQNIAVLYCATAAEKRGLLTARDGFQLAGLAEFGMRLASADQVVQF